MATICIEDCTSVFLPSDTFDDDVSLPPLENQIGDIIFVAKEFEIVLPVALSHTIECNKLLYALSIMITALLGVIVWVNGGVFMYYIPLYLALMPLFYWIIKISYAYVIAKAMYPTTVIVHHKNNIKDKDIVSVSSTDNFLDATLHALNHNKTKQKEG